MKISTSYTLSYVLYFHKYISCNYFNVFAYNSNIYRICYFAVVFLLIVSEHVLCKLSIFLIESQALWFWKWRWKSSRWYYFHQRSSAFSLLGRQSRGKKSGWPPLFRFLFRICQTLFSTTMRLHRSSALLFRGLQIIYLVLYHVKP